MFAVKMFVAVVATASVLGVSSVAQARYRPFSPEQMALLAGGGVAEFAGSAMRSKSDIGGAWDVRMVFGTRFPIAFEVGYTGIVNRVFAAGSRDNSQPNLLSNSVDGALRLNLTVWRLQPFIFGGVGYNNMRLINRSDNLATAAVFTRADDQLMVPFGGGIATYIGRHATFDARFTYRKMFYNNINVTDDLADQWTVTARIGWAF